MRKNKIKLSLRPLLIIPFLLEMTVTVGLVGYLSFRNGEQVVNNLASQLRTELTARIRQQIQSYIQTPFLVNGINGMALAKGDINIEEVRGGYLFWQQAKTFPPTNFIYCGSEKDGAFLGVGRSVKNKDILQLQYSNQESNYFLNMYGLDQQGSATFLQDRVSKQYNSKSRPWYKIAKEKKQPTWSEIYIDFDALVPVITASNPVYNQQGELLGVCATDFFLAQELNNFLQGLNLGKLGETFIMESSGTLVSSSTIDEEKLILGEGEKSQRLLATESKNFIVRSTAEYLRSRYQDFSQIDHLQKLEFKLSNGERQFVQISPFNDRQGIEWLIVVVIPESQFMEKIYENTQTTIKLCIISLIVAGVIGIITARLITRPIQKLNQASEAMALGDLEQNVQVEGIKELEKLADSFNGMAGQLKTSFTSLETMNMELENRVEERTVELRKASEEIVKLNQQLSQENQRMSAELEVVQQLQKMILPTSEELAEILPFDLATFMKPAEEVGGDYFDILEKNGRVFVSIGDVTGHGLESGVVMLMAQTAVRTLLAVDGIDLVKILNILNEIIYTNTQRMKSSKNMTLVLLEYVQGKLRLSGQHEDLILVKNNGKIDYIETGELGFPLGLELDISPWVAQREIELKPGDVAVLYTDGITEAMNEKKQFYGKERLSQVIQVYHQKTAEEISQAIVDSVQKFIGHQRLFDDITLVVIKLKEEFSSSAP